MAYLIYSKDGRTRIGTHSAASAVDHVMQLRRQGHAAYVTTINGKRLSLNRLRREVKAA